jgi:hypothetical protein
VTKDSIGEPSLSSMALELRTSSLQYIMGSGPSSTISASSLAPIYLKAKKSKALESKQLRLARQSYPHQEIH